MAKNIASPDWIRALDKLRQFYFQGSGLKLQESLPQNATPFFTGVGSSADAAAVAAMQCRNLGTPALAVETSEVLTTPSKLINQFAPLVYISASGEDPDVLPFLHKVEQGPLIAVTRNEQSALALSANLVLPMLAEDEAPLANKAYLNSIALLWMMCRRFCSAWDGSEEEQLKRIVKRVQVLQSGKASLLKAWHDVIEDTRHLIFTGQGPQHISSLRCSAIMAGTARKHVQAVSLDAVHSGFIELSEPGMGMVIFASSANGLAAELQLANEMDNYGVNVLLVIDGMPRRIREEPPLPVGFDPFLSTILDTIPALLWSADLAQGFNSSGSKRPDRGARFKGDQVQGDA